MMKEIEVLCPEYRGAPQPEFDPMKINEAKLPDNMRFKEYDYNDLGHGKLELAWKTQEPYIASDVKVFLDEVQRAFEANGAEGLLVVTISDRDGECLPLSHILEF